MLSREEILQGLKRILLIMDPNKKDAINNAYENTRLQEDLGLASVSLLYLVVAIEEEFGIEFDELGVEDFKTVGQTIDYIESKLN